MLAKHGYVHASPTKNSGGGKGSSVYFLVDKMLAE